MLAASAAKYRRPRRTSSGVELPRKERRYRDLVPVPMRQTARCAAGGARYPACRLAAAGDNVRKSTANVQKSQRLSRSGFVRCVSP